MSRFFVIVQCGSERLYYTWHHGNAPRGSKCPLLHNDTVFLRNNLGTVQQLHAFWDRWTSCKQVMTEVLEAPRGEGRPEGKHSGTAPLVRLLLLPVGGEKSTEPWTSHSRALLHPTRDKAKTVKSKKIFLNVKEQISIWKRRSCLAPPRTDLNVVADISMLR